MTRVSQRDFGRVQAAAIRATNALSNVHFNLMMAARFGDDDYAERALKNLERVSTILREAISEHEVAE